MIILFILNLNEKLNLGTYKSKWRATKSVLFLLIVKLRKQYIELKGLSSSLMLCAYLKIWFKDYLNKSGILVFFWLTASKLLYWWRTVNEDLNWQDNPIKYLFNDLIATNFLLYFTNLFEEPNESNENW